jgi:hypothetical protein
MQKERPDPIPPFDHFDVRAVQRQKIAKESFENRSWIALRFVQASTLGNVELFPDLPTKKSPSPLLQC